MKKIMLKVTVILTSIFLLFETASYIYIKSDSESYMKPYNEAARENSEPILSQRYAPVKVFNQDEYKKFRSTRIGNKPGMLFFGCSYIYGQGEKEENTIPYLINEMTGRTTINRGIPGGSIYNSLHDLKNEKFINEVKNTGKIDYVVYVYINDHKNRINNPYIGSVFRSDEPRYKIRKMFTEKNGQYKEESPGKLKMLSYFFYTTKAYYYLYSQKIAYKDSENKMISLLEEAKRITDKEFPGAKFVIMQYKDGSHGLMSDSSIKKLTDKGFTIIDSEEAAGHELESEEWRGEDKEHPNAAAFKDVAKGLVKELNL